MKISTKNLVKWERKSQKKISLKCFRELGASSRLVSENEKLSVTFKYGMLLLHLAGQKQ